MYSRGNNAYGQQPYTGQSAYNQNLSSSYAGNSAGGPDSASRNLSILGASRDPDIGGYRNHTSTAANYGGQYGSVYSSAGLSSSQQVPLMSAKGPVPASLEGRSSFASARQESPKYAAGEYGSSARGYGHKIDPLYAEKILDYPSIDRRQYGEQQSAYMGRDLRIEPSGRYADSVGYGNQHQFDPHDRIDQAALLRREQLLKVQSLQSASVDNGARQVDYLASRGAALRHPSQDMMSYGGGSDPETRNLRMMSNSSVGSQQTPSILGAAPHRAMDDIMSVQGSSNPGYGVSLPPGRDYGNAKGLHGASLELDYPGSVMSRGAISRLDKHKDDRAKYELQLELREEECLRGHMRDRDRQREREKEREREREREREHERERERLRVLERREKERERDRRLAVEVRRDRTPIRLSRDRRGPSLTVDVRPSRRDSPRHESSHRRHSPVKEKRREYVCKVHSYRLVDVERDYLSLDKRYPKLFVPPEFSKLVVHWPREDLKLSLHTAVSFEHDFVDDASANLLGPRAYQTTTGDSEAKPRDTVWNAKVLLMSGLSRSALEDLVSESDDRLVHICNILRFCILKKDRALSAIGGPWGTVDGGDPSTDDTSLEQTALRHTKDITNLDLCNCRHWNRFLEIHYDRIGEDGLFSHKEVTVLFMPDLSECLPSFDVWKTQWLEHRRAVAERERLYDLKREIEKPKEEPRVEKAANSSAKIEGKKSGSDESESKGDKKVENIFIEEEKKEEVSNEKEEEVSNEKEDKLEAEQVKSDEKDVKGETSAVTTKTVKKKIVKKVVKKVADKGASAIENAVADPQVEMLDGKYVGEDDAKLEIGSPSYESPANTSNTKTIVRKKVAKKVPVGKSALKEKKDVSAEVKTEEEPAEDSPAKTDDHVAKESPVKTEDPAAETGEEPVVKIPGTKTTIKRKIIKKVPKKKPTGVEATEGEVKDEMVDAEDSGKQSTNTNIQASEAICSAKKKSPAAKTPVSSGKKSAVPDASKAELKGENSEYGSKFEKKSGMVGKIKDGKDEVKSRSKEVIEKMKQEEPPRPGFILKTKSNEETKVRSLSLSLESLLDYTDKDIDDSTFEISVFAESVYEMLQYQMASRIFAFLQKLRIRFISKRNQKKREREETNAKDKEKDKTSSKRSKNDDAKANDSAEAVVKVEKDDNSTESNPKAYDAEEVPSADDGTEKMEEEGPDDEAVEFDEDPEEEDPEEDPEEEDDEMKDANSPPPKPADEENDNEKTEVADLPGEKVENKEKAEKSAKDTSVKINMEDNSNPVTEASKDKKAKAEDNKKETSAAKEVAVDKELLQAFRFFDRNRVGYIRVEDMRLIIHAMGKYLPHRDVKELVQSALLESNTGRDDHILYNKLVRMADV